MASDIAIDIAPLSAAAGITWASSVRQGGGSLWRAFMGPLSLFVEEDELGTAWGKVIGLESSKPLKETGECPDVGTAQADTVLLARRLLVEALLANGDIIDGSWSRAYLVGETLVRLSRCAAELNAAKYTLKLKDQAFASSDLWGEVRIERGQFVISFTRGRKPPRRRRRASTRKSPKRSV